MKVHDSWPGAKLFEKVRYVFSSVPSLGTPVGATAVVGTTVTILLGEQMRSDTMRPGESAARFQRLSWILGALIVPASAGWAGETTLTVSGTPGAGLGYDIKSIGDVDGDGRGDVLVGAPEAAGVVGQAQVISGATGLTLTTFTGVVGQKRFGKVVANAGDVDADGVIDYAVATPNGEFNFGIVRVFSGATGALLNQTAGVVATFDLGFSVEGLGDVDGDGFGDIAMGSPDGSSASGSGGVVWVVSGATGAIHLDLDSTPGSSYDDFGWSLAALPDLNNDGMADFAVGAVQGFYKNPQGFVRIVSGADGAVLRHVPNGSLKSFGWSISAIPDVDGDTLPELAVGAPATGWAFAVNHGYGAVAIVSSGTGAKLATIQGIDPNEQLGTRVSSATDYAVDGTIRVAAIGAPLSGTSICRVYALDGTITDEYSHPVSSGLGWSLANVGDIDGDDSSEIAFGLPKDATGGANAGAVHFVSCDGFKDSYGTSCGGAFTPSLGLIGCPAPGSTLKVVVANGPSAASGVLLLGSAPASVPVGFGCSLLVSLPLLPLQVPFTLNGSGSVNIVAVLPPSTPSFSLTMQAWIADVSTPLGYSATNGFRFGF